MIKTGSRLSLFLFLMLFTQAVFADVKVQGVVDRNEMGMGDTFTLQVRVSSDKSVPVNEPSLPVIKGVQLLHKWVNSQSQSSVVSTPQGIDFKTVETKVFNYQFAVTQKGNVQITPIDVEVGGKTYQTDIINLSVLDAGQVAQAPQNPSQLRKPTQPRWPRDPVDSLEERFNQLLQRQFGGAGVGGYMTEPRNGKESFFILAEVDKTEAYKGEQVLASWYLYTRGRVREIDTLKYPTLKGFWKEDIQISTHLNFEQDVINGIPYNRALLASYALFPIDEGKTKIDPYKAKATIVGGFAGRGYQGTKASESIPILVKPLPEDGKPLDFTGAVGEFQMTAEVVDGSVVTNQPFALKVRFEGRGNAKLIELPQLQLGDSLEVYDIKNESKFFKNGQSFKEFEVLLIPREPGELTIKGLTSSFFDTKAKKYVSLKTENIRLNVLPGTKQLSMGDQRLEAEGETKSLPGVATQWDPQFTPSKPKLFLWMFAFAFGFLVLMGKAIYDMGWLTKKPDLKDQLKIRFSKVDKLIGKSQLREVGIEVTNIVYMVLGDISGLGGANEELDKVLGKTAPSVRREIEDPLRKLMDYFGVLGFGPKSFVDKIKDTSEVSKKVNEMEKLLMKAIRLTQGSDFSEDKT